MLRAEQVVIPDIYADDRIPRDAYRPTFVRSLVMMPVRSREAWAAIGVYWADRHEASPVDVACLQALADSTAVAMENARILRSLQGSDHHAGASGEAASTGDERMLRMCAWTRRINIGGEWITVEEFLRRRLGVTVTHTISQDALEALWTDGLDT
jgi:hypothetical protein